MTTQAAKITDKFFDTKKLGWNKESKTFVADHSALEGFFQTDSRGRPYVMLRSHKSGQTVRYVYHSTDRYRDGEIVGFTFIPEDSAVKQNPNLRYVRLFLAF